MPFLLILVPCLVNEVCEPLELSLRQIGRRVAKMRGNRFFQGTIEKRLQHAIQCATTNAESTTNWLIDIFPALLNMFDVPLFLEDSQQRTHGSLAGRIGQVGEHTSGGSRASGVENIHDLPFATAQT